MIFLSGYFSKRLLATFSTELKVPEMPVESEILRISFPDCKTVSKVFVISPTGGVADLYSAFFPRIEL